MINLASVEERKMSAQRSHLAAPSGERPIDPFRPFSIDRSCMVANSGRNRVHREVVGCQLRRKNFSQGDQATF